MPENAAIGIDVGGTHVRAALVDNTGEILAFAIEPTPPQGDPEALAHVLRRLTDVVSAETSPTAARIGVALPGIRDDGEIMRRAVNLPRLEGVDVGDLLGNALDRPVLIETDANAAGWAQWHALDPRPQRFVYLTIGTGVGGCVVLDGAIVRHTRGGPGHLGHLLVDTSTEAPECRCGARGCLEAFVARENEPLERPLANAFVQIAHLYAPDVIAVGGGVIDGNPELVERARAEFEQIQGTLVPEHLEIRRAELPSDQAGVIGAALLAMQK